MVSNQGREWVRNTLKKLSLEEKIGQMLQIRYYAGFNKKDYNYLRKELLKYHIGSVVFEMKFNQSGAVRVSAIDAAKVANELQRDSKYPLLVAADLERGVASRLQGAAAFPWQMAFGAIGDVDEVKRFAAIAAYEARAVGIQWALAPVADVNNNPANPVINDRSFGEDPEAVGRFVSAFVQGARENGMLVTAKHFPGHGDSSVDSHRGVPSIDGDLKHLQEVELVPFKKAIEAGADSIMLAHARVPAIEPDPNKIATTSYNVVTEMLKGQLGFRGLVVTDALEMKGLTMLYDPKKGSPTALAAVDAVKAGCDIISIPTDLDGAFHAIVDAVRNGEISASRVDESVTKILEMKASVGLNKSRFVSEDLAAELISKPEDMAFAQHVADAAVTLVRDKAKMLPLRKTNIAPFAMAHIEENARDKALVAVILGEALTSTDGLEFEKALKLRRPDANVIYFDNSKGAAVVPEILNAVNQAQQVVVAVYVAHNKVRHIVSEGKLLISYGPLGPSGNLLERILESDAKKTAIVALGSPYLIVNYPEIETYICTYAQPSTSEISAVKALFGEIQNHAKLPVTLPGIAPRGFSLPWPIELLPVQEQSRRIEPRQP